jgi:hypothetical protein
MIRTQIQLDEEQARAVRRLAAAEGKSVAEVIRTAVDLLLGSSRQPDRSELKRRARAVAGRFQSRLGDVAAGHDRYLGDDYRS